MNSREWGQYINQAQQDIQKRLEEAEQLILQIKSKVDESEAGRAQGAAALANLNTSYQQITELISKTNTELAQINGLRARAFDPSTGIEAILTNAETLNERAAKIAIEINDLSSTSKNDNTEIKKTLESVKKNAGLVEKEKDKANALLEELQNTYELAVNTGLAGSFDKRRKRIEDGFVTQWRRNFFRSLAALGIIAAIILMISLLKDGFTVSDIVFFRLSLLTPLIFYTGYAAVQYGKERTLLEKYAFKAAVASSLGSYSELLIRQFSASNKDIAKFVIDSMSAIYMEPHEQVRTRSFHLGFKKISYAEFKEEMRHEIDDAVNKAVSNVESSE
jgi:hypothetical protein